MARYLLNWRVWIGIAFSVLCLWLAIRDIPFNEFWDQLGSVDYIWLIPGVICILLATLLRGHRWTLLLERKVSTIDTFWAFNLGNLFNNFLPLRAGDAVRILVLSEKSRIPAVQITATFVVERLMDVSSILLMFVAILPFMDAPDFAIQAGLFFGVAVIVGLIVLITMVRYQTFSQRMIEAILSRLKFLPKDAILTRWSEAVAGFQPMTRPQLAVQVIFLSLMSWIVTAGFYGSVLVAFGSESPVVEAVFVVVVISLAITLPSSPGFIGVFHLAGQQALVQPFGDTYTDSEAFGIILVAYIVFYLTTSIAGGFGLLHFGRRFFALSQRVAEQTDVDAEPQSASA